MKECTEIAEDTKIVLSENKSKMYFINSQRKKIKIITVDGCAITIGLRCDYLVICNREIKHFVELKGSDVEHAIKQLETTIKHYCENPIIEEKLSFIISTHSPLTTTTIQIHKKIFKKKYNSSLVVKNGQYSHTLN